MLATSNGKIYLSRDCFPRLASVEFNLEDIDVGNSVVHLTNITFQKHHENYFGRDKKFINFTYKDIFKDIEKTKNIENYEEKFWDDLSVMIKKIFEVTDKKISARVYGNNFELFGIDIMIDDNLNLRLIEVIIFFL